MRYWLLLIVITLLVGVAIFLRLTFPDDQLWGVWAVIATTAAAVALALILFITLPRGGAASQLVGPPSPDPGPSNRKNRLRGLIDVISVEIQNLQRSLDAIRSAGEGLGDRTAAVKLAVEQAEPFLDRNSKEVRSHIDEAVALANEDGRLLRKMGRDITELANAWERGVSSWPTVAAMGNPVDVAGTLERRRVAMEYLDEAVVSAARVTVPSLLLDWASAMNPGDVLDFNTIFVHELPAESQRKTILEWLADAPLTVPGIVDAQKGTIQIASPDPKRRRATWVLIINVVLWGGVLAALVPLLAMAARIESPITTLTVGWALGLYALVMLGGLAHVGIDALKAARDPNGSGPMGVEGLAMWAHVNERHIVWGVAALLLTWLLFVHFEPTHSPWFAFVIGYSADSFFDVFIGKFSSSVTSSVTTLTRRLTPTTT